MSGKDEQFIQPETSVSDEDFDDESNWEAGSILTLSVFRSRVRDGRLYAEYGKQEYGFPMDEKEVDRMDLCHAKYYALLGKRRFLAPIQSHPQSVLDLGCGTGSWSIDFADAYPSAEVLGIDIAPTQPDWVPPNCRFEIGNMEQPWPWKEDSFDFIFLRDPILSVRDFPKLLERIYAGLKPGGWVEFQSVVGAIQCDDGTMPPNGAFAEFSDRLRVACDRWETPVDDAVRWKGWFETAGFETVTERVFKIPCNTWPKDPRLKLVGAFEMDNLLTNFIGLSMQLFKKGFGWSAEEVVEFIALVKKEVKNQKYHTYWPYYVTYARKPLAPTEEPGV